MKFDELDSKMRVFETAQDRSVLPEMLALLLRQKFRLLACILSS